MVLALLLLPGCAGITGFGYDADFSRAERFVKEKRHNEAAAVYAKIAKEASGSRRGAEALFAAATTRVSFDNSQKDYLLALQEFDEFIEHYPDHEKTREARHWRSCIKTIVELRKENERLNQNIEQLKKIDIRHEERRRK